MSVLTIEKGDPLWYRGPQHVDGGQRAIALAAVVGLHVAVIGVLLLAGMRPPVTPPEPTLIVSFVPDSAAPVAPAPPQPPQPTPPPPETQMIATSRPTPSPMTAPPVETVRPQPPTTPAPPLPTPPAPAAPASSAPPAEAVTPPNFTAAYLNNPGPAYPAASRRKREQGTVRLRVQVSEEGAPAQVLLDRSSGYADLDAAAQDIVKRRWRFAPAKQGGRPVSAWVIVPMEFSLTR